MRGYSTRAELPEIAGKGVDDSIVTTRLVEQISKQTGLSPVAINSVRLFYVRQTNGEIDGKKIVFYFEPEFIYVVDIGMPRLALVSLPYQVPTVKDGFDYKTIGRGDGDFPDFDEARVFSSAGLTKTDILYAATPGALLIGAKSGVTEQELRQALSGYVQSLSFEQTFYFARVAPFDEEGLAQKIMSEVEQVRYAAVDHQVRNNSGPWWVDRVL